MQPQRTPVQTMARAGLIAALYAALTLVMAPVAYGPLQIRLAEALTLLPLIMPLEAVPGLFIGCLIANLAGGYGILDVVFGSAATLIAALLTARCRTKTAGALAPVLVNAFVIGTMLYTVYYGTAEAMPLWLPILQVGMTQAVWCFGLGIPLVKLIEARFPAWVTREAARQ